MKVTRFRITAALLLALSIAAPASAIEVESFGLAGGVVRPDDIDPAFIIGGFLSLGEFAGPLELRAFTDYWGKTMQLEDSSRPSYRDWSFGLLATYQFKTIRGTLLPFLGAGPALHLLRSDIPGRGPEQNERFGAHAGGGIRIRVDYTADVLAEFWYMFVDGGDQWATRLGIAINVGN